MRDCVCKFHLFLFSKLNCIFTRNINNGWAKCAEMQNNINCWDLEHDKQLFRSSQICHSLELGLLIEKFKLFRLFLWYESSVCHLNKWISAEKKSWARWAYVLIFKNQFQFRSHNNFPQIAKKWLWASPYVTLDCRKCSVESNAHIEVFGQHLWKAVIVRGPWIQQKFPLKISIFRTKHFSSTPSNQTNTFPALKMKWKLMFN